jgi:hypothetical protein
MLRISMSAENCESCRYSAGTAVRSDGGLEQVYCRRYPPQLVVGIEGMGSYQPNVMASAWCGEYRRREPVDGLSYRGRRDEEVK